MQQVLRDFFLTFAMRSDFRAFPQRAMLHRLRLWPRVWSANRIVYWMPLASFHMQKVLVADQCRERLGDRQQQRFGRPPAALLFKCQYQTVAMVVRDDFSEGLVTFE